MYNTITHHVHQLLLDLMSPHTKGYEQDNNNSYALSDKYSFFLIFKMFRLGGGVG